MQADLIDRINESGLRLQTSLLAKGTIGFGTERVSGRRRVPNPPTRINAFISDALLTNQEVRGKKQKGVKPIPLPNFFPSNQNLETMIMR